jgi:zinc protease
MKLLNLVILVITFVSMPMAYAKTESQTQPAKIHEYQLNNGLKVIVKEDHRAPVATLQVWYKVGSTYEPDGITGISHALEHMMFRGSKNYSAAQFLQTIAESGGQQNAFTFYDYTGYYETMGVDKLPVAFKLEADRMRNLLLADQDFAKEIQVVMEERRMRVEDNPQQLMMERFLSAANVSGPYHHPVIGWMSDLQNMTVNDLRKWYQTWYAPNNAVLVVVGDVDPQKIYQLAQQHFGTLKPSTLPVLKPENEAPPLGTRTVVVEAPAKVPNLLLGYNVPVVTTTKEKWQPYALLVLAQILGGSDSSRLQKDLVRQKQIATGIDTDYEPYFRKDTIFMIEATPTPGHTVDEVKTGILNQVKSLQNTPVTADELERAKAQIIASKIYQEDSIEFQAYEIGTLETVGLSWREIQNAIKQIEALTPTQIQTVAKEYLTPLRLTVGILKPLPMPANQPQAQSMGVGEQHVR